jgi:hypothetical protein
VISDRAEIGCELKWLKPAGAVDLKPERGHSSGPPSCGQRRGEQDGLVATDVWSVAAFDEQGASTAPEVAMDEEHPQIVISTLVFNDSECRADHI